MTFVSEYQLPVCFLKDENLNNTSFMKNKPEICLNELSEPTDNYCQSKWKYVKGLGSFFFESKAILFFKHILKKRLYTFVPSNSMNQSTILDPDAYYDLYDIIPESNDYEIGVKTMDAVNGLFENIYTKNENEIDKKSNNSTKSSKETATTTTFLSTISTGESTMSVIGTPFTTILSEPTTTKSEQIFFPTRSHSRSHDNTYTIIGVSAIAILIIIVAVILVIFGVRRSLRKQETLEDMLYRNEMNAHAKLVAESSIPGLEKIRSSSPSSTSVSTSFIDQSYSSDRMSRIGAFHSSNRVYGVQNNTKFEDLNFCDPSTKHYYNSQIPEWSSSQYSRYSSHNNYLGQPMRSLSMSSRPKDYMRSRYSSHGASVLDNSLSDQRSLSYNDNNGLNFTGAMQNQQKFPYSGYSREQNKGYFTPSQIRSRSLDPHGANKSFNHTGLHDSHAQYTPQSNVSSINYTNIYHTPLSAQVEPISFDTANTHFSDTTNTLSSPLSYQNSGITSLEHDSGPMIDLTPPKSLLIKESAKANPSESDLGIEKIFKANNRNGLRQNSFRTPSINASVDIWAEKKKKLLDLTSNLNEYSNNSRTDTSLRTSYMDKR
ncbi:hypothetical protein PORY_001093 [Pneumocystis oryctolagi]|uniref:Uncharacterized protein n=1 Tax=Pneumocystis oryctolagi TaxID=42067 RepID=A0ACB7CCQ9_9ASCO|nr:hypothetical protein PORY_001093 [Pneumocystis oryctolagi]